MSAHQAILCIGSNTPDAAMMIGHAVSALIAAGCGVVADSGYYVVSDPYVNRVIAVGWEDTYTALLSLTKDTERVLGRTPEMKPLGLVPVDIDVVLFDGDVIRPRDFEADYFSLGYKAVTDA